MNSTQTIDKFTEKGHKIAEVVISALKVEGIEARIDTTYRDYGQNLLWETVIVNATETTSSYQLLTPAHVSSMNDGTFDYSEITKIVEDAVKCSK